MRPEINVMKRVLLLAAAALTLTAFVPEQADAQVRRFGVRGPVVVGRGPVYAYPRGYYGYRRGYYLSGCETSFARAITWRALGRAHRSNGGS